ncbi:MAG: Tfp pilus assembly protein FimT/FimU [Xenococcaceae cyanobacterium]
MSRTKQSVLRQTTAGFSLLEMMIVTVVAGILIAIAAPNLVGFLARQRLNTANNEIYLAMRKAQSNAKKEKVNWQASFREQNEVVEWTVHRQSISPTSGSWESLPADVLIDDSNTTLYKNTSNNLWRVRFNYKGNIQGQLGRITLYTEQTGNVKRCVFVSTLLGALRTDSDEGCD